MPAVGHLYYIWGRIRDRFGKGFGAVPAHHLGVWIPVKHGCDLLAVPGGQQLKRAIRLKIDKDGSICAPLLKREIIDADERDRPVPNDYRCV